MGKFLRWSFILCVSAVVVYGNACSNSFNPELNEASENFNQCLRDEASMSSLSPKTQSIGYLGRQKIAYENKGNNWILIDGDKLVKSKGALPTQPDQNGISLGVGVSGGQRWPGGQIPYEIPAGFPAVSRITDAINHWNQNLGGVVRFIGRTNQADFVTFKAISSGCAAPVGYFAGEGAHEVELASECGSGNVAHELGHIVGLDHEQNRLSRDQYVTIDFTKVQSGYAINFQIDSGNKDYYLYDFGSIMHYSLTAFSIDGNRTIIPKVALASNVVVGQRSGLTLYDINSARIMYDSVAVTGGTFGGGGTTGTGVINGLYGRYYRDSSKTEQLNSQVDQTINFNYGNSSPVSNVPALGYAIKWTGYVAPQVSGKYNFHLQSSDSANLYVSGNSVANLSPAGVFSEARSGTVDLVAGTRYPIKLEFTKTIDAPVRLKLQWMNASGAVETIPAAVFYPDTVDQSALDCSGNLR